MERVEGLRIFMYGIVRMIQNGVKMSCEEIENMCKEGVASHLLKIYSTDFDYVHYSSIWNVNVDKFFMSHYSIAIDEEDYTFAIGNDDGLLLLINIVMGVFL